MYQEYPTAFVVKVEIGNKPMSLGDLITEIYEDES